jgi:hypothetical protein
VLPDEFVLPDEEDDEEDVVLGADDGDEDEEEEEEVSFVVLGAEVEGCSPELGELV